MTRVGQATVESILLEPFQKLCCAASEAKLCNFLVPYPLCHLIVEIEVSTAPAAQFRRVHRVHQDYERPSL